MIWPATWPAGTDPLKVGAVSSIVSGRELASVRDVSAGTSRSLPVAPSRVSVAPPRFACRVTSGPPPTTGGLRRIAAFVWLCTSSTTGAVVTLPSNISTSLVDELFASVRFGDQLTGLAQLSPTPPIQVYGPLHVSTNVHPVLVPGWSVPLLTRICNGNVGGVGTV